MFRNAKSNNGQSEKLPLTPEMCIANKAKSDDSLISRSSISQIFANSSKPKQSNDKQSFQKHLKHLNFTDKENKINNF